MWPIKLVVWGLNTLKSPNACTLSLATKKEAYNTRRSVQRKKFGSIRLTGQKKGSENCIMVVVHMVLIVQYVKVSLQVVQSVLTVFRVHRMCPVEH